MYIASCYPHKMISPTSKIILIHKRVKAIIDTTYAKCTLNQESKIKKVIFDIIQKKKNDAFGTDFFFKKYI